MSGSRLLIDEQPLQVIPSLACKMGLNRAMFLQQLHYWLQKSKHERDGKKWVFNTYEEWHEQFPFWKPETIRKLVKSLENSGHIITTSAYNKVKTDRTKWYTIDYDRLNAPVQPENRTGSEPEDSTASNQRVPETNNRDSTEGAQSAKSEAVESLANHTMKAIYQEMKDEGFTITNADYGRLVARVQWALDNMAPTEAELEALPEAYLRAYKIRGPATDAVYALNELRRQAAREEVLSEGQRTLREPNHPHSDEAEAARGQPRTLEWYLAFYPGSSASLGPAPLAELLGSWIREGVSHSEIVGRLERGAA